MKSKEEHGWCYWRDAMFPSPYGECGLKFVALVERCGLWTEEFPSPYGECGLKFKKYREYYYKYCGEFPSPYGECGLKLIGKAVLNKEEDILFPSPYGECGLKYEGFSLASWDWDEKFPSPYGECGLKFSGQMVDAPCMIAVSVPLRGMWFEITDIEREESSVAILNGFPSPYGECGLKFVGHRIYGLLDRIVSVPLRGMWFEISYCRNY